MTLTLDVKPETEARLREVAQLRGVEVGVVVDELAARVETANTEEAEAERRAAIHRARGMLSQLPGSVDDFLQERHAEAAPADTRAAQSDADLDALLSELAPSLQGVGPLADDAVAQVYEERESAQL